MPATPSSEQDSVIAGLERPQAYGPGVDTVARIDTHAAIIFLAGAHAYKMKRTIRLPYLDYSTIERRRAALQTELELNRTMAPQIYLDVRPVTASGGGTPVVGGEGPALDWVLVMRRFDQDALFDRLAQRSALTQPLLAALTDEIARFHDGAPVRREKGGAAGLAAILDINERSFAALAAGRLDAAAVETLNAESRTALAAHSALLETRRREGHVRLCHGDLHLRNICLVDGAPRLFDRIEFSEVLACVDVLYDLSFLLMDLDHRGLGAAGNLVFNRYLDLRGEADGLPALPLFLSMHAAVRAHVGALGAARQDEPEAALREARAYLDRALALLRPAPPCLLAVGGLSGTGKTTLAHGLAPRLGAVPGARVLRSDVLRKRLMGVAPETPLPERTYDERTTARVYAAQRDQAAATLRAGCAVIADAVFARPQEREAIAAVATDLGVPFVGLWLAAPADVLEARVAARTGDASDADVSVVRRQLGYDTGPIDWTIMEAGGGRADTLARAQKVLEQYLSSTGNR